MLSQIKQNFDHAIRKNNIKYIITIVTNFPGICVQYSITDLIDKCIEYNTDSEIISQLIEYYQPAKYYDISLTKILIKLIEQNKYPDVIKKLIIHPNCNLAYIDEDGKNALTLAISHQSLEYIKLILDRKDFILHLNKNIYEHSLEYLVKINNSKILDLLFKYNKSKKMDTILHDCLFSSLLYYKYDIVKILLENGADPNHKIYTGETIFIHLINSIEYHLVKLLLSYGADPNIKTWSGDTAIFITKNIRVMKSLLRFRVDHTIKLHNGNTPLIYFSEKYNNIKVSKILIKNGCDINSKNEHNKTYLNYISPEHIKKVKKIIRKRYLKKLIIQCLLFIKYRPQIFTKKDVAILPYDVRKYIVELRFVE